MRLSKRQMRFVYAGLGLLLVMVLVNPSYSSAEISTPEGRKKVEKWGFGPGRIFEHTSSTIIADDDGVYMNAR